MPDRSITAHKSLVARLANVEGLLTHDHVVVLAQDDPVSEIHRWTNEPAEWRPSRECAMRAQIEPGMTFVDGSERHRDRHLRRDVIDPKIGKDKLDISPRREAEPDPLIIEFELRLPAWIR